VKVTVPPTSLTGVTSRASSPPPSWTGASRWTPGGVGRRAGADRVVRARRRERRTTPTSRLLFVSLRVIVTVEAATPSARTGPVPRDGRVGRARARK
jgi:hypothetical protein